MNIVQQLQNVGKTIGNDLTYVSGYGLATAFLPKQYRQEALNLEAGIGIGILTAGVGDIVAGATIGGIEAGTEATAVVGEESADTGIAESSTTLGTRVSSALSDLKSFISPTIKVAKYALPIAFGGYLADIGISTISEGLANLRSAITGETFTIPYQLNQFGMPTSTSIGGTIPVSQPPQSSSVTSILGDLGILLVLGLGGLIIYEVVKKV
jgi:hypothetical protein